MVLNGAIFFALCKICGYSYQAYLKVLLGYESGWI